MKVTMKWLRARCMQDLRVVPLYRSFSQAAAQVIIDNLGGAFNLGVPPRTVRKKHREALTRAEFNLTRVCDKYQIPVPPLRLRAVQGFFVKYS
jgi:hypothetical protein